MTHPTRLRYFTAMLDQAGWPIALPSLQALVTVAVAEHPRGGGADWNPIDTILYAPGATPYNSFSKGPPQPPYNGFLHVWNYPSASVGVQATIDTLAAWPLVEPLLAAGTATAAEICHALDSSDGVGGGLYEGDLDWTLRFWDTYSTVTIPGPGPFLEENVLLVGRVTGTLGPVYLIGGPPLRKQVLSAAEEAQVSALGWTLRNYTAAELAAIPNVAA